MPRVRSPCATLLRMSATTVIGLVVLLITRYTITIAAARAIDIKIMTNVLIVLTSFRM